MLNQADQPLGGDSAQRLGVLTIGGQSQHLGQMNAVVAHDGHILRNLKTHPRQSVLTAYKGVVIREQNAGRPLRQLHQLHGGRGAPIGIVINRLPDIFLRNFQPQFLTGPVEAHQSVLGNGGGFAVEEGNPPVTHPVGIVHQSLHALDVVRHHRQPVVEHMIQRHQGQIAFRQLPNQGIQEIHAGDDHPVHPSVAAVLQIGSGLAAHIVIDKGNVVAVSLGLRLEAFQNGGKILMTQAAALLVHKQHPQMVGAVGFQGAGSGIGHIAHFLRHLAYPNPSLLADVRLTVQRLAHRGHGDPAGLGDVLHGYQG